MNQINTRTIYICKIIIKAFNYYRLNKHCPKTHAATYAL